MIKRTIIGCLTLFLVAGPAVPLAKTDEAEAPPPPAVTACQDQFPKFKDEDPFAEFTEGEIDSSAKFELIFTAAQDYYHGYISCIFDAAVQKIIGSNGTSNDSTTACLDPAALKETAGETSSGALLPYVRVAYNAYSRYLGLLQTLYRADALLSSVENAELLAREAELKVVNESQNALTAISTTFAQLAELRQAFVLHVQFQCILKNLDDYRKFLAKLRTIVLLLPARIIDASVTR